MAGLLDVLKPRTCPFGHGEMGPVEGFWALAGVNITPGAGTVNALQALFAPTPPKITPNNQGFVLRAWKCQTCGNVQLFDSGEA